MIKRRELLSFLAIVCVIYATLAPTTSLGDTQVLQLDHAEFVLDGGASHPPDSAGWNPQSLPDNWSASRSNIGGFGWYRLRFTLVEAGHPNQLYAIYLPRVALNAAFYVNGVYVGSGGQFNEPVSRNWNRAQYYLIPPHLLRREQNTLHVRLWAESNTNNNLTSISLGPADQLSLRFERRYFLQTTLTAICTAVIAVISLLTLYLWGRRRQDSVYGYIGFAMLFSVVTCLNFYVRDPLLSSVAWDMMVLVFECGTAVFVCLCALRMVDLRWPRFEALLWLFLLAAPIAMVFARGDRFLITSALGIIIVFIYLVALGSLLARRTLWHRWKTEPVVLTLVMAIFVGSHDIGMLTGVFPADGIFYRPIAGAVASIVVGWLLISRFVDALRGYAKLNIELEGRVAQKHAELEENYKRMNQLERQSATVEERQRIMRDMHDGLGAQLISTLSLVEHGDLAKEQLVAVLRECLDDLRLTIDSLESTENDLLTVLGNFRYRLEPRLKSRGIQLDWQVKDLPKLACLTPQNVLHVLRILQEAFTNILKHARANIVKVETGIAGVPGKIFVSVSDNGIGLTEKHPGHGLANMRRRAQAIGGTLDIVSAATGTMITLSLPNA